MPFCTNCGTQVDATAAFCPNCGTAQGGHGPQFRGFVEEISDRTAGILCYIPVFGVIPAIVFLASQSFRLNQRVRFDAFQSLYLFLLWLVVTKALPTLFFPFADGGVEHAFLGLLHVTLIVCWIYLLVKAAQNEQVRLPVLGDLAARSIHEQL